MGDRSAEFTPVIMTREMMVRYLDAMEASGHKVQTIRGYRKSLADLYDFLPEDKRITGRALSDWETHLRKAGYSDSSISVRMSVAKGYIKRFGAKGSSGSRNGDAAQSAQPQMQRSEYYRFLSEVRRMGTEREYLLVMVFASIDIGVKQLRYLTVEACRDGAAELPSGWRIDIPAFLRRELLRYAAEHEISSGAIFISRRGNPLDRTYVTRSLRDLAVTVGAEPEKCNPRALRRMYRTAREEDLFAGASEDDLQYLNREELIEKIHELQKELELCRAV